MKTLDINPQTKIGELLEAYPQLENVLLQLSPSFAKLKNPILRKTVGRIASLRQVAEIGGLELGEFVAILRKAAGIDNGYSSDINIEGKEEEIRPEWAKTDNVSIRFDASAILESGASPMKDILNKVDILKIDEVMLLITPFKPIPIIELLTSKGYFSWSDSDGNKTYTYVLKKN